MHFAKYVLVACMLEVAIYGLAESSIETDNQEDAWPIFGQIHSFLKDEAHIDWPVLDSSYISQHSSSKTRVDYPANRQKVYPIFLDDCQIPKLHEIYGKLLGFMENGTFVEVGASDGRRWSNTWPLAQIGWTGHYIEPIPQYAQVCALNHAEHSNIKTHILAIGAMHGKVNVHVGASLSTCSAQMLQVYSGLEWSSGYHTGEIIEAPMRTLDYFLAAAGVHAKFEILVIDVEGFEFEVLQGFSALYWRPRIAIVEIEDKHESFRDKDFLQERFRRVRAYFRERGYVEYWRDHINTVFYLSDAPN